MQRALVALALVVLLAGAFTAGALIFRDDDPDQGAPNIVESEIHCIEPEEDCGRLRRIELDHSCGKGVDGVKLTIVYEEGLAAQEEQYRRTFSEDC